MNANTFYKPRKRNNTPRSCVICLIRWPQEGKFCRTCGNLTPEERRKILDARERAAIARMEREAFVPPPLEAPLHTRTCVIEGQEFEIVFDGSCR